MYINRLTQIPDHSCFLLGPRGTGKTMMLRKRFPNALYIDLLEPVIYHKLLTHPEHLKELVAPLKSPGIIIIDEIQKVTSLLEVVHSLIEEKKGNYFILTGSSARKLKKTGSNLLGGRALEIQMHPFTIDELVKESVSYSFNSLLSCGLIPIVFDSKQPQRTLASYVDLYLREEILQEGLTRNIQAFSRFMEAMSFSHGCQLNISNISRECNVPRKTAEGYVEILKDLLIGKTIPPFTRRSKRQLATHPKFYFFDTGLFNQLRPKGPLDRSTEIEGAALEGLVFQHLNAWLTQTYMPDSLYFWRTKSGLEVDFVLYTDTHFIGIEVKNSTVIRPSDLRPLKNFKEEYPEADTILLYRGEQDFIRDNIHIIPVEKFLKSNLLNNE